MEATYGAIVLPEAAANQDTISLNKGKPPTVETDGLARGFAFFTLALYA